MELLRDLGFHKLEGIDPSSAFIHRARGKGLSARVGNVYDLSSKSQYDVILLMDVLEHLANPGRALKNICSVCKANAKLILNVPVCDSFTFRARRLLFGETKQEQLRRWDETHIQVMDENSVLALVRRQGFLVESGQHVSNPFPLVPRLSPTLARLLQPLTFGGRFGDFYFLVGRRG